MALIKRFEDIQAWQEARVLVKMIYTLTKKEQFSKDYGMKIAEGFDCESKVEFARFLGFARRSAVETQSLLYAALDINYITQTEFDAHYEQARKAKALIGGFKRSLGNK